MDRLCYRQYSQRTLQPHRLVRKTLSFCGEKRNSVSQMCSDLSSRRSNYKMHFSSDFFDFTGSNCRCRLLTRCNYIIFFIFFFFLISINFVMRKFSTGCWLSHRWALVWPASHFSGPLSLSSFLVSCSSIMRFIIYENMVVKAAQSVFWRWACALIPCGMYLRLQY